MGRSEFGGSDGDFENTEINNFVINNNIDLKTNFKSPVGGDKDMANDNNIKTFTAADIEKYHKGLLSAKQMHDLEKAALDDPFLADALEGYAVAGVNVTADITELKKRLAEKTEAAKVISMVTDRRKPFPWMKIAAAVVIIAGSALLANQFLFKKKSDSNIAQAETTKKDKIKITDSSVLPNTSVTADTKPATTATTEAKPAEKPVLGIADKSLPGKANKETSGGNAAVRDEVADISTTKPAPVVNELPKSEMERQKLKTAEQSKIEEKEIAKEEVKNKPANTYKKQTDNKDVASGQPTIQNGDLNQRRAVAATPKTDDQYRNNASNTFRGRITDANNTGVPFANVTNPQDNVGTYSDARGYFNLTYPDTVLNVQVRSIGFENNNVQLRNNVSNNQVVLQDDRSLSEVVINTQKPNAAARSRESNVKMEESEPTDGWDNYDSYLVNNLKAPEEFKTKQTSKPEVAVSFEVDKNGEPVNFKIEKSLCSKCDKEAIRLIKDGPKWKHTAGKKGRTTVIINF